jgi:L-histidine N-alpha-methyltransferase
MTIAISSHLTPSSYIEQLRADAFAGLTATPKSLPPKYRYDRRGSELFDEITRLPEYYPTSTERQILVKHAAEIAAVTRAETLNELGSGTSEKTRLLLDALHDAGTLRRFVPFDVDATVLTDASTAVAADYPGLDVLAVVGDFEHHLELLPRDGRRLVAFLGSTIGNFEPADRAEFLTALRATLAPGDSLLLGIDLVKETSRLIAAYDDSAGLTAAFNRNVLSVLNSQLNANFDLDGFDHVAVWNPAQERIEVGLRSTRAQIVRVAALDLDVSFATGEEMRTSISAKFRPERVQHELEQAGLQSKRWWTDPADDFALCLSVPD